MDVNQPTISVAKLASSAAEKKTAAQGILGWLILPVLGLFYMLYKTVMMSIMDIYQVQTVWVLATNENSAFYVPRFESAFYTLQMGYGLLSALLIWTFITAIKWQRKAKVLLILTMLLYTALTTVSHFIFPFIFDIEIKYSDITAVINGGFYCMIWIPYLLFSDRVKQTFIR